jgi:hypothetical protein
MAAFFTPLPLVSSHAPYRAANNDAYKAGVGSYVSRNAVNAAADDNRKGVKKRIPGR